MKPDKGNNKKNTLGLISIIMWALVLTMLFKSCTSSYANANQVQVDYSIFRQWVVAELVESVRMESGEYVITLKEGMERLRPICPRKRSGTKESLLECRSHSGARARRRNMSQPRPQYPT